MAKEDVSDEGAKIPSRMTIDTRMRVSMVYRNHRGVTGVRRILPRAIWYGVTEWHPEPQWLLEAFDIDKETERTFAMKDIIQWGV